MKTLQSAFIAGCEWFESRAVTPHNERIVSAAEEYAKGSESEAESNLNRAIDAETELRKAKELLREWMGAAEKRIIPDNLGTKTKSMIEL